MIENNSTINEGCSMMVNTLSEEQFFLSYLKPNMRILEFGSGLSSLVIAPLVKELVSIEHDFNWFTEMKGKVPSNVHLYHVGCNREPTSEYSDGTFSDFNDYVLFPLRLTAKEKFDVVFVDGRSRVACCRYTEAYYLKPNGIIIIHDYKHFDERYRRPEYEVIEEFLDPIAHEHTMWAFKPKQK